MLTAAEEVNQISTRPMRINTANSFAPLDHVPSSSSSSSSSRRVSYFYDPDVGNYVYYLGHPMKPHRIRMAHNLIVNYGLCSDQDDLVDGARDINAVLENGQEGDGERRRTEKIMTGARGRGMQVFRPKRATQGDMTKFHSDEYIEFLEKVTPETREQLTGGGVRCLTGEDCPAFEGLFEFCSISAGGSLGAAEKMNSGAADIAINWAGGLHHAKKTEASGFCYVNDIVLGILELLRIHPRVLYIDVDVHHGDGVEEAFYTTDRVMTASFHRFGQDFFPGTGDVRDIGMKRGKGYAVNVPLRDGIRDDSFHSIFKPVVQHLIEFFRPGAIVLQMGADSLAGDKLGGFNLTLQGHAECATFVKSFNLPTMMLGGGGYTTKNVARAWTYETAVMCEKTLSEDLPYNQYMEYYGPRFKLEVLPNNTDNHNPPEYIEAIKQRVLENLRNLPHAPGVQMTQVPSKRISQAIGMKDAEMSDPEDEVEARVRRLMRKRQLNGNYSSSSDSDSDGDPSITRPARSRRQGGTARRKAKRPVTPSSESMDDDPCGVRRKRTFFRSAGEGTVIPQTNGFLGAGVGGVPNGKPSIGLGTLGVPIAEVWRDGVSRAGSPASVA